MLDRWVYFRVRTVLGVLVLAIAVFAVLKVVMIARDAFVWFFVALFLALALNPESLPAPLRGLLDDLSSSGPTFASLGASERTGS